MTTPPEPKATEPSDADLLAICDEAFSVNHQRSAENRALYNAGRDSRDAEVEALKAERQALVNRVNVLEGCAAIAERERDKLHAELGELAAQCGYRPLVTEGKSAVELLRFGVEALNRNLEQEIAEHQRHHDYEDKLHAAIAWRDMAPGTVMVMTAPHEYEYRECGKDDVSEEHDGTPAGRAAALVRLFERCTDGK